MSEREIRTITRLSNWWWFNSIKTENPPEKLPAIWIFLPIWYGTGVENIVHQKLPALLLGKSCSDLGTAGNSWTWESVEGSPDRTGCPKKCRQHLLQGRHQIFRFIKDLQGGFAAGKKCGVFELSWRTYYGWLNRWPSKRTCKNEILKAEIQPLHHRSKERLGSPKHTLELNRNIRVSRLIIQLGTKIIWRLPIPALRISFEKTC